MWWNYRHDEAKSNDEETKIVSTNFNEKSRLQNTKFLYFACIFINYYSILKGHETSNLL